MSLGECCSGGRQRRYELSASELIVPDVHKNCSCIHSVDYSLFHSFKNIDAAAYVITHTLRSRTVKPYRLLEFRHRGVFILPGPAVAGVLFSVLF